MSWLAPSGVMAWCGNRHRPGRVGIRPSGSSRGRAGGTMAFPDIHGFPTGHPGPYELQRGGSIAAFLRLFAGRVPDAESNARVSELASEPAGWSAGHAVFDEVRRRLLVALEAQ